MRNVLHYVIMYTVATYNVITVHKVIPAHNLKQLLLLLLLLYVYHIIVIFQYNTFDYIIILT